MKEVLRHKLNHAIPGDYEVFIGRAKAQVRGFRDRLSSLKASAPWWKLDETDRLRTLIESALSSDMTLWSRNRLNEALALLPPHQSDPTPAGEPR